MFAFVFIHRDDYYLFRRPIQHTKERLVIGIAFVLFFPDRECLLQCLALYGGQPTERQSSAVGGRRVEPKDSARIRQYICGGLYHLLASRLGVVLQRRRHFVQSVDHLLQLFVADRAGVAVLQQQPQHLYQMRQVEQLLHRLLAFFFLLQHHCPLVCPCLQLGEVALQRLHADGRSKPIETRQEGLQPVFSIFRILKTTLQLPTQIVINNLLAFFVVESALFTHFVGKPESEHTLQRTVGQGEIIYQRLDVEWVLEEAYAERECLEHKVVICLQHRAGGRSARHVEPVVQTFVVGIDPDVKPVRCDRCHVSECGLLVAEMPNAEPVGGKVRYLPFRCILDGYPLQRADNRLLIRA